MTQGDGQVAQAFTGLPLDRLVFTGSTVVGLLDDLLAGGSRRGHR
ncbi:hypothetical protein [Methylobacterium oryzae]